MSTVAVLGCGVTGTRVATHLVGLQHEVLLIDPDRGARRRAAARSGATAVGTLDELERRTDLAGVALCLPAPHAALAERFAARGVAVVSVGDDVGDTGDLLTLAERDLPGVVVVGAAMSPGLSGEIARHLTAQLHTVDEIHVAVHGTGGPSCARQHHRALGGRAVGWHDDDWLERRGGSGRELCWFPDPIGARDCYRAELSDPLLLRVAFPRVHRISARVSATRRDRLTARLPMLRPPHREGLEGAVRVEARGSDADGSRVALVLGASGPAGTLAAATCAGTLDAVLREGLSGGVHVLGAASVSGLGLLARIGELGVRLQEFTGVPRAMAW